MGFDLVAVDAVGAAEGAFERARMALLEVVAFALFLFLFALLALDRDAAVGDFHFHVLLVEAGQIGGDFVGLFLLGDVDGGDSAPAQFAVPERLYVERRAAERRAPEAAIEIVKEPVD